MQNLLPILLSLVLFASVTVLVDALVGFIRRSRGIDEDAIGRRLSAASHPRADRQSIELLLSHVKGDRSLHDLIPFVGPFKRLVRQSGSKATLSQWTWIIGAIWAVLCGIAFLAAPFD